MLCNLTLVCRWKETWLVLVLVGRNADDFVRWRKSAVVWRMSSFIAVNVACL